MVCGDPVVGSRRYGEVGDAFIGVSENKVKDVSFGVSRLIN